MAAALALVAAGCSDDAGRPSLGRSIGPIVGGSVDSLTRGVVSLGYDEAGAFLGLICSGTLISPNVVLTATHCVTYNETGDAAVDCSTATLGGPVPTPYVVVSPETTFPTSNTSPSLYRAREIRSAVGTGVICGNDVSLVLLEGAGIPPATATPIEPRLDDMPASYDTFDAIGYGFTSTSDATALTVGTRMRIDGRSVLCRGGDCSVAWQNYLAADEWLGDAPICPGDSGGPALDAQGRVEGVASRGGGSCNWAVYAGLPAWKSFIIDTVTEAAQTAGISPPSWTVPVDAGTDAEKSDAGAMDSGATTNDADTSQDANSSDSASLDAGPSFPGLGEPCTSECATDLACVSESGTMPSVCLHKSAAAAPSTSDGGCACAIGSRGGASGTLTAIGLLFAAGLCRCRRRRSCR